MPERFLRGQSGYNPCLLLFQDPILLGYPITGGKKEHFVVSHLSLSADIWTHFSCNHQCAQKKTRVPLGPTEAAFKINGHICYQDTWDLMATWKAHVLGDSLVNHSAPLAHLAAAGGPQTLHSCPLGSAQQAGPGQPDPSPRGNGLQHWW